MRREKTEEIEFTVVCVNEFARKYGMTNVDALKYLDTFKGLDYVVCEYEAARCQPLELTLEDMLNICRRNGGLAA